MLTAQLLLSIIIGVSVLALFTGVSILTGAAKADNRLQELLGTGAGGSSPTLRQLELSASFYHRAVKPAAAAVLHRLGRFTPQKNLDELHRKLETAGFPSNMGVIDFLGFKTLSAIFLAAVMVFMLFILRPNSSWVVAGLLGLSFGFAGFAIPNYWLYSRIHTRQLEILRALPDALDMMTISVDAGLGLSGAIQHICEHWDNALIDELTRVLAETRLGRSRIEALESMAQRTGVKEITSFVMAITLAEKLGANISKVLHIQAEQMRVARRQRAEQLAREAAIKMLFPLVFLIFPAMFAVILGPAVPLLLETFKSF